MGLETECQISCNTILIPPTIGHSEGLSMCLICKNLHRRKWTLDEVVETLLHHWEGMDTSHREEVWVWVYDICIEDRRFDLVRKLLE